MAEPNQTSPLAAQVMQRLQKLGSGNGMKPEDIRLYSSEENTFAVEGTMTLLPLFETHTIRHSGGPSNNCGKVVGSSAELKSEIDRQKLEFETKPKWINEAITKLKEQPAGGWGLDDVRISLPDQSLIIGASETCPSCQGSKSMTCQQCNGAGYITCPQCQGRRQEPCRVCMGSGENPAVPSQPCINCNGMRYASCRYCNGHGSLNCPTCHGSRGTTCSSCEGAGVFTEEVSIACGARTQFKITGKELPSGLRRGLDRLGAANLVKGHADIETLPPVMQDDDQPAPPPLPGAKPTEQKKEKVPKPEISYIAKMPYADLRMSFLGKKVIVSVFGKKNVLMGVPAFLDKALEPAREQLKQAVKGVGSIDEALKVRAMRDALTLQINSNSDVNALRRIYPHGLSQDTAAEILRNMRAALNKLTLRSRTLVAILCGLAGSGIFAGVMLTPVFIQITQNMPATTGLIVSGVFLFVVMAACWFSLSAAARLSLQKRFPKIIIPRNQHIGKTGYTMLAFLLIVFIALMILAPAQPDWLRQLLGKTPQNL